MESPERREAATRGTGNVFADLGFTDAAERQARLRLAYAVNRVLEPQKLSQADAAKVMGSLRFLRCDITSSAQGKDNNAGKQDHCTAHHDHDR